MQLAKKIIVVNRNRFIFVSNLEIGFFGTVFILKNRDHNSLPFNVNTIFVEYQKHIGLVAFEKNTPGPNVPKKTTLAVQGKSTQ